MARNHGRCPLVSREESMASEIIYPNAVALASIWLEGVPVVNKQGQAMQSLTTEQQQQLLAIIADEFGAELEAEAFAEALQAVLEDMAGFETASQQTILQLTQQLWSNYHE